MSRTSSPITPTAKARLSASREDYNAAQCELGRQRGLHWANDSASFAELKRLATCVDDQAPDFLTDPEGAALAICGKMCQATLHEAWRVLPDFKRSVLGLGDNDDLDVAYLEAFIDEAVRVYEAIEAA